MYRKWAWARIKRAKREAVGQTARERGQSIVEMALAFPVLLLLLMAVIDFARIIDAGIVLTNAAREGARYGSMDTSLTVSDIQQLVVNDVLGSGTNVTVMSDFAASDVAVQMDDDFVTVTITYDFELWFGGIISWDDVMITREAVMPVM
jgi:Flp pilus assembly protein TadG